MGSASRPTFRASALGTGRVGLLDACAMHLRLVQQIADRAGCGTLAYLSDLARLEAEAELAQARRKLVRARGATLAAHGERERGPPPDVEGR